MNTSDVWTVPTVDPRHRMQVRAGFLHPMQISDPFQPESVASIHLVQVLPGPGHGHGTPSRPTPRNAVARYGTSGAPDGTPDRR